jgi:hypothetical protein
MPRHRTWSSYYLAFIKQCGRECWRTWRGEVLASAIFSLFLYLINRNSVDVKTALLATGYTVSAFVLWHTLRVPWILYQKLDEAEHLNPIWGFVGVAFLTGTCALIVFAAAWFWELQPRVDLTKVPDGRDVRIVQLESRVTALTPEPELQGSLRRRTIKLANDIDHYVEERWAIRPPVNFADFQNQHPTDDQKKTMQIWAKWNQESHDYFRDHYKDQWVRIVKEYDSKGVKIGTLINDAEQYHPVQVLSFPFPPGGEDSMCQFAITRFRELAYRVNADGSVVDIKP